jgi:hypothetical protein
MARARDIANIINSGTFATQESLSSGLDSKINFFSDIYASSTSGDPTTVNLVRAVRSLGGTSYEFNNLIFNMPSNSNTDISDWTSPGSSYKWSYVYIRPTDNKFFLSNNAPNRGTNFRTIGSSQVIYLFPIYSRDTSLYRFQLSGDRYSIQQMNAQRAYATTYPGIYINGAQVGINTSYQVDFDSRSKIPETASNVELTFSVFVNKRNDSGATAFSRGYLYMQDDTGSYQLIAAQQDYSWFKTPDLDGQYYLYHYLPLDRFWISTTTYNVQYTRANVFFRGGFGDAATGWRFSVHSFIDRSIF